MSMDIHQFIHEYFSGDETDPPLVESKPNFIPEEWQFAHNYCFFLHDVLAQVVVEGEALGIFEHGFDIENAEDAGQLNTRTGDELIEWMKQNGYEAAWRAAARRQICIALLSDLCHFVYEALECSQKGKLTVTFALLRKPLKENLFYLEWMLADPQDFSQLFHTSSTDGKTSLTLPTALSPERRLQIITEAVAKAQRATWVPPQFIYELRYDKKCDYGFESLFQQANHLITTMVGHTEEENLNFIFTGEEDRQSQWEGLYRILPILLLHAVKVVVAIVQEFNEGQLQDLDLMKLRSDIGFLLLVQSRPREEHDFDLRAVADHITNTDLPCLGCHSKLEITEQSLHNMYWNGMIECTQCGYKLVLTNDQQVLLGSHLVQGYVKCPNCQCVIVANAQNIRMLFSNSLVTCHQCQGTIEVHLS